ncbi:hypothetical protein L4P45_006477, partial [Pseudomonas aeruginosa]|nr:hypothetical protein [Pseudomonas aeruginosa]
FVIVEAAVFSQAQILVEDNADGQSGLRWISAVLTNDALDLFTEKVRGLDLAYSTLRGWIS